MDDGIAIDVVDTRHDALLELVLGGHPDVAQDRAGELGEEAFNKVEPRAVFGGEGEFEASDRSSGEPGSGFFRYVRGMIIEDQLDRGAPRVSGIEKSEEVDELAAGWRSLTRVWTLPVSRSIPANRLSVPWRLYS